METIGQVYQNLGLFKLAEPLLLKTLEIRREAVGENHYLTGTSRIYLAWLYFALGRRADAEPHVREGIRILEAALPEEHFDLARGLTILGILQRDRGEFDPGRGNLVRALELGLKRFFYNELDFASLHGNREFEALAAEARKRY
jgi:tetratricopeptide (TPR) repeat protein